MAVSASTTAPQVECFFNQGKVMCKGASARRAGSIGGGGLDDDRDHHNIETIPESTILKGGARGNDGLAKEDNLLSLADDGSTTVNASFKLDSYTITLISIFVAQIFFCFGICCWTKA